MSNRQSYSLWRQLDVKAFSQSSIPQVVGPSVGKDLGWSLHLSPLRTAAPKGVDPYQLYLRFSEVPELETSMV